VSIPTIAPAELQALISAGATVDLIDVRNTGEFAAVHAAGAINRPLAALDPARILAERKAPADDPLYLICASGMRSLTAAQAFIGAGFANVVSVAGGTIAWEAAGLTVVCAPASVPLGKRRGFLQVAGVLVAIALWIGVFMVPHKAGAATGTGAVGGTIGHGPVIDFAQAVIAASKLKPVVVVFYAVWCQPCKMLEPDLDAVLAPRGTTITVVRIDTDNNQTLAKAQGISAIPNVQLWRNGVEVAHFSGVLSRKDVSAWLDSALARH
jgi:rhodanese-related sulfurtransferase/thiol-disulfide isomerase/thioredoxin